MSLPAEVVVNEAQLNNRFGLRSQNDATKLVILDYEQKFFYAASLKEQPTGSFDANHLKALNQHYFGKMYEWAGEFRSGDGYICDGRHKSTTPSALVSMEVGRVLAGVNELNFQHDRQAFGLAMAAMYKKLVALAPFPHGNELTIRQFIDQLAVKHEFEMDWSKMGTTEEFRDATIAAVKGNFGPLKQSMSGGVNHLDFIKHYSVEVLNGIKQKHEAGSQMEIDLKSAIQMYASGSMDVQAMIEMERTSFEAVNPRKALDVMFDSARSLAGAQDVPQKKIRAPGP